MTLTVLITAVIGIVIFLCGVGLLAATMRRTDTPEDAVEQAKRDAASGLTAARLRHPAFRAKMMREQQQPPKDLI